MARNRLSDDGHDRLESNQHGINREKRHFELRATGYCNNRYHRSEGWFIARRIVKGMDCWASHRGRGWVRLDRVSRHMVQSTTLASKRFYGSRTFI
jgi:hypothetical protein